MSAFGTPVHCNTCLQIGGLLFRTLSVLPLGSSFRYANNGPFGRLCQAKMKNQCISLPPTLDHCLTFFIGCCWGGGFCQKFIVLLPCSGCGRLFRNMKTIAAGRANKKPAGNGGCNCGGSCGDASLGRYIIYSVTKPQRQSLAHIDMLQDDKAVDHRLSTASGSCKVRAFVRQFDVRA